MKKRFSLTFFSFLIVAAFSADEIELPDGTKFEADVMMYKAGQLMMIKKDGSRVVMPINEIKQASFEPPEGSFMPMMLPGGGRTSAMVQDYAEGTFNMLTTESEDKSLKPDEIAAIQFRTKSTIAMDAAEAEVAKSKDPKVKEAASKRISDEDLPEAPASLSLEVPRKVIDGLLNQLELREELEELNGDFEGGKKTESRIEKVMEELKEVSSDVGSILNDLTEKNTKEIERCQKEFEKLDEKQSSYDKQNRDVDPILAEKAKVDAIRNQHLAIKNALIWNCTRLEDPARESAWLLMGKGAPSAELYIFGKGRTKLDKKSRQGTTIYSFWSTKNRESQKMVADLAKLSAAHAKDPVHFYAINVGDNMKTLKTVMPKLPRLPNLHHAIAVKDTGGKSIIDQYRVMLFPSTYIINADGEIESLHISANSKVMGMIEDDLDALLKPADAAKSRKR
jgi:hypothetical protein